MNLYVKNWLYHFFLSYTLTSDKCLAFDKIVFRNPLK